MAYENAINDSIAKISTVADIATTTAADYFSLKLHWKIADLITINS